MDGSSVPRIRTRQQFLKYCVDFIEKRNKSTQNVRKKPKLEEKNTKMGQMKKVESGKSTENSSHSCTDVSRGLKGKKTCSGRGEKAKMGKNVESSKKKFTCKSIHETSDPSPDDVEKLEHESDDDD